MTTYLEFPWPYCLFTMQLLWGYSDDQEPFVGENFIQERFGQVRFWAQFSTLGEIFQGLDINFKFSTFKRHTFAWDRVFWAIARKNPLTGLTCRSAIKKVYENEKNPLYFTPLPRSPQWLDLHEILHRWSSRGRNHHLFQILCRSVKGFWICEWSNFAILHWLSRTPLTHGCTTARLW